MAIPTFDEFLVVGILHLPGAWAKATIDMDMEIDNMLWPDQALMAEDLAMPDDVAISNHWDMACRSALAFHSAMAFNSTTALQLPEPQYSQVPLLDASLPGTQMPDIQFRDIRCPQVLIPDTQMPVMPVSDVPGPDLPIPVPELQVEEIALPQVEYAGIHYQDLQVPDMSLAEIHLPEIQFDGTQDLRVRFDNLQSHEWQFPETQSPGVLSTVTQSSDVQSVETLSSETLSLEQQPGTMPHDEEQGDFQVAMERRIQELPPPAQPATPQAQGEADQAASRKEGRRLKRLETRRQRREEKTRQSQRAIAPGVREMPPPASPPRPKHGPRGSLSQENRLLRREETQRQRQLRRAQKEEREREYRLRQSELAMSEAWNLTSEERRRRTMARKRERQLQLQERLDELERLGLPADELGERQALAKAAVLASFPEVESTLSSPPLLVRDSAEVQQAAATPAFSTAPGPAAHTFRVVVHGTNSAVAGQCLRDNHWAIYMLLVDRKASVRLNMAPELVSPTADAPGVFTTSECRYTLPRNAIESIDFAAQKPADVNEVVSLLEGRGRLRYQMAVGGAGARWCV